MHSQDDDFQAWLRKQDDATLDADLVIYGTSVMTSIMTREVTLCPKLSGGSLTETVIVNAYPEAKLVTLTYPQVDISDRAPGGPKFPGVVMEIPVRTASAEHPNPIGDTFSHQVGRHLREGWKPVDESERTR